MSFGFKVGEIAILQNTTYHHEYEGSECEVVDTLKPRNVVDMGPVTASIKVQYMIRLPDGMKLAAAPHQLRKKEPPKKDTTNEQRETLSAG